MLFFQLLKCPMHMLSLPHALRIFAILAAVSLLVISCGNESQPAKSPDEAKLLAGTWVLRAKIVDGKEEVVTGRQMRLHLREDGTFRAEFRGDANQEWTRAGKGAFSYIPPDLTFFWDTGQAVNLLVVERDANRFRLHHGRNLVPLKDGDADEIFVREGPTAKSASGRS